MKPEATLKKDLKDIIEQNGGHYQDIESSTGVGIPDVNAFCKEEEFWIETKIDTGVGVLLRPAQRVWLYKRCRAGGNAFIVCRDYRNGKVSFFWGCSRSPSGIALPLLIAKHGKYVRVLNEPDMECYSHDLDKRFLEFIGTM